MNSKIIFIIYTFVINVNYEASSIDRPDKGKCQIIDPRVPYQEKKKGFKLSKAAVCATAPDILQIQG